MFQACGSQSIRSIAAFRNGTSEQGKSFDIHGIQVGGPKKNVVAFLNGS
jgi:hypothetical protein